MKINRERPLEEMVGTNRAIIRQKLGRIHCSTPFREVVRKTLPKDFWEHTPAMRRGFLKCVWDTWQEYRNSWLLLR